MNADIKIDEVIGSLPVGVQNKIKEVWRVFESENLISRMDSVVENNIVHKNISVLRHTIDICKLVSDGLDRTATLGQVLSPLLDQVVGKNFSRRDLLIISILFHDLGKIGYGEHYLGKVEVDSVGVTTAANHELASCLYLEEIQKKYKLFDAKDYLYLLFIVKNHSGWSNDLFRHYKKTYSGERIKAIFSKNPIATEILIYQYFENKHVEAFSEIASFIESMLKDESFVMLGVQNKKLLDETLNEETNLDKRIQLLTNIGSKPWGVTERLAHFSEEVGELFDVSLKVSGMKDKLENRSNVISAMADVYSDFLILLDLYGVNLEEVKTKCLKELEIVKL